MRLNLWRLEWLRLVRTHRLLVLVGTYVFFGFTGPLTARYVSAILGRLGTEGVRVEFPEPVPADGIAQFVGNASQIGLLVVVLVAASALAFDARREMAVFLRTRVPAVRHIVVPAYVMTAAAAAAALVAGSLAAWYETAVLLGPVPVTAMLTGMALGSLFLAFAVSLTAAVASVMRGAAATAGVTLAALLLLAIVGGLTPLGRWLPTRLAGAMTELVRGASTLDYWPAVLTSLAGTAVAVTVAVMMGGRREV
jgi:ABC-2 type transport system permease protein